MQYFSTKQFYANDTIFKEGSTGNAAYILKEGSVEISIKEGEKKIVLAVLKPVSVIGEMALLLKDHKRIATATALEAATFVEVNQENFEKFMASSPAFIKMILSALSERLCRADAKVMHVPDIFIAVCEILNLLFGHGNAEITYDLAASAISNALSLDTKVIKEQLSQLEQLRLIEISEGEGHKIISSPGENFLAEAMKIRKVLLNFSEGK